MKMIISFIGGKSIFISPCYATAFHQKKYKKYKHRFEFVTIKIKKLTHTIFKINYRKTSAFKNNKTGSLSEDSVFIYKI